MAADTSPTAGFAGARTRFEAVLSWADSQQAAPLPHGELEAHLQADARETFRQVFQDILDRRAAREVRLEEVTDSGRVAHRAAEQGHDRPLETVFGTVTVTRIGYRRRGEKNLYPADGALNLPVEIHSHGLRRMAAMESTRDSFHGPVEAIERRQVEALTHKAAVDFEAFYQARRSARADPGDVLVLSADGKGIVMRPEALRQATAKAVTLRGVI